MKAEEIVQELSKLQAVCDGRPMDERLANTFSWLMSELEKLSIAHEEEVKRLKYARYNLGDGM